MKPLRGLHSPQSVAVDGTDDDAIGNALDLTNADLDADRSARIAGATER